MLRKFPKNNTDLAQMAIDKASLLVSPHFEREVPRAARDDNALTFRRYTTIGSKEIYRFGESLFFAQFRQDAEILERGCVSGYAFAAGNFLE